MNRPPERERAREARRLLAEELDSALDELVPAMVQAAAMLPDQMTRGASLDEERDRLGASIRGHLEMLRDLGLERVTSAQARGFAFEAAKRRARADIPLDVVLRSFQITSRVLWKWLGDSSSLARRPDDALRHAWSVWMDYANVAIPAAADAYVAHASERAQADSAARRDLAEALLNGTVTAHVAADRLSALGLRTTSQFLLVHLARDSQGERRKSRAGQAGDLAQALRIRFGAESLEFVVADELTLVVVGQDLDPGSLREEVARVVGAGVAGVVGDPLSLVGEIPAAYRHLRSLVRVDRHRQVRGFGGIGLLDHASAALADLSDLACPPDLARFVQGMRTGEESGWEETLEAWAAASMNVRSTAEALHVHLNSVYYRLNRIRELSGRDPHSLRDLLDLLIAIRLFRGRASTDR